MIKERYSSEHTSHNPDGVGFAMIGFGIWMLARVGKIKKAYKLVGAAP
ncbi:hypothetical protein ABENE_22600 [Asticcacaulis benevestitus DSM 16100 = ATCC BAA-896]|uniref:Uncharacterized protein n=1 Tax=Asticcacaulis benevestitus DSM 16100 = ATCC BAA-896 TaxID=1121022 RepID=V4NWY9_9CAUL|nr:hypothetical protein ABENE_22600 [Asticcacaulis benevestitus DSM 16100 = ATCC BAA-896]